MRTDVSGRVRLLRLAGQLPPLGQGNGTVLIDIIVNRGADSGKNLKGQHILAFRHCPFSSPEWLMRGLDPIVESASAFLSRFIPDRHHRISAGKKGPVSLSGPDHSGLFFSILISR